MIRLSLVIMLSLLVNLASCQSASSSKSGGAISTVSVTEFQQKLAGTQTAQLIDVRTPDEFSSGHLKNAVNIDIHSDDFMDRIAKLDKTKPVMVYCRSGARSSSAAGKMKDAGFKEIYNLDGGISSWTSEGKPVE
jgi:thioredoxin 1